MTKRKAPRVPKRYRATPPPPDLERPQPVELTDRELKVQRIVQLMTKGLWTPGMSEELGREWKQAPSTVRDISAEASRFIRQIVAVEPDQVIAPMLAALDDIRMRARARQRTQLRKVRTVRDGTTTVTFEPFHTADPDFDAELRSMDMAARLLGLYPRGTPDVQILAGAGSVVSGVVILPAEDPPPSVETTGSEVAEPKRLNGGSNGNGHGRG
jgi:hypothetical protein